MIPAIPDNAPARANTRCIRTACERLGLPYRIHDEYGNFISVGLKKPHFFVNFATPFNNGGIERICKDKEFTWKLLREVVSMPRTKGYFDPYPSGEGYEAYVTASNYEAITQRIVSDFPLPAIVKMNTGQQGEHVYLCTTPEDVVLALTTIFSHTSPSYDYIAIAQEYLTRKKEYRVVVFDREVVLVYEKDFSEAMFVGNLSPLHYEGAKALHSVDSMLIERLQKCIDPLFDVLPIEFAGIDIVVDDNDQFHVLELNTQPGFAYFVRDNGDAALIGMYEKLLRKLV